jgi:hypothetical protein
VGKRTKELYGALKESNLDEAETYTEVTVSREGFDLYNSEEGTIAQAKFIAAIDFPPMKIPEDELDFTQVSSSLMVMNLLRLF